MKETGLAVREELAKVSDQLLTLKEEGETLEFRAEAFTVGNEQYVAVGRELLGEIGKVKKKITDFIKPVNKAFKKMVASFSAGATSADTILRKKLNDYAIEQEEKRQEAVAKIREQQEAQGVEAPLPIHIASPTDTGFRTYWKWRVVDREKIPEKYFVRVLNETMIDQEVTAQKETFKAPGIETYTTKGVVAG